MNDFYNSILNINNQNKTSEISLVVKEEIAKLSQETSDFTGFCKYIAYAIYDRLKELSIKGNILDLTEIVGVNHTVIVTDTQPRVLIDPTFIQFVKNDNNVLVGLDFWPSDKLNSEILQQLLINGFLEIDNLKFENYINCFSNEYIKIELEEYILNNKLNAKKI